jgi:hypothetical protein
MRIRIEMPNRKGQAEPCGDLFHKSSFAIGFRPSVMMHMPDRHCRDMASVMQRRKGSRQRD